ncbi:NAD(P)-dependent dehydrogenase, short-chain alcohol dehydrogenase family [Chishuiella changwenlii]|uniref:NAD(P)-dependent dehydrogenase, short-chain alcohol dehydrogenase family n=1 Tax=Chishuiella changwenlii TaxID=1434701 RepID=A0A1M6V6H6_9FLAO|nr:SDR family oxidoreductase [Chishuiella changwenlii]GGF01721.1 NAD(P)-dependent oxidoreductase [Chishuiella changwenlii]SHK77038.1 NAD(P)-dependent dehydrogenase, short-chain alcohol dehydrogenase family [Chishuiella changwenlii]
MKKINQESQQQKRPGEEKKMKPVPETSPIDYQKEGKLAGKIALITGGDSGIGKATALLFAQEGADLAIVYLSEKHEASKTKKEVEKYNVKCKLIKVDLSIEKNCEKAVEQTIKSYQKIDILINNAALHWESESLEEISTQQLEKTFKNNVFSCFWVTKYALPYMKKGSSIINTTSVTAYRGSPKLIDYAATKGAIVSFTRSLAANLVEKEIRVNAVAPGPVWTPLIVSSFEPEKIEKFGTDSPMGRAGMPNEIAPAFLFLACEDSRFISGQVIHPNGSEIVNG